MIVLAPPLLSTWLCGAKATGTLVALSAAALFFFVCCADEKRRLEGAALAASAVAAWCLVPQSAPVR